MRLGIFTTFFSILFFLQFTPLVLAVPRYAVEEGVGCVSCHTNMTGAGKRNDTGGAFFTEDLVLEFAKKLAPKDINGRLHKYFAVGTDIRLQNTTTFGSPKQNNFTLPQASLYVEFNPVKYLTGYVDYDLANTVNREAFALVHELPHGLYLKFGRINLPYGLRIDDDTSPIRTNFNMTFSNQDLGGEVGIAPGPFEFAAAISNGVPGGVGDENLAKAVTTSATWIGEYGRVGASFQWNKRTTNRLLSAGMHGGLKLWKFTWLGEVDTQQIHSLTGAGNTWLVAGYSELNWKLLQGLYVKTVYDYLDPDLRAPDNLQHRLGLGFDLYPLPFSHVSLLYRINQGLGVLGDDQLLAQFHLFF